MTTTSAAIGGFKRFGSDPSRAVWPVWSDSKRVIIEWPRIQRSDAYRWYRLARAYNRDHAPADRYGGLLGSAALRVFEALIFDFLNFGDGRLDPAYEQIARRAGLARSTVAIALRRLKELHLIDWTRRCTTDQVDGQFILRQVSNAYRLLSPSSWLGYKPAPGDDGPPVPVEWGQRPPLPDQLAQAAATAAAGGELRTVVRDLAADPSDKLAQALAELGRAIDAAERGRASGLPGSEVTIETGPTLKI